MKVSRTYCTKIARDYEWFSVLSETGIFAVVFTRDSCTEGRYCGERLLAMGILSVCPSATTRYGFKVR